MLQYCRRTLLARAAFPSLLILLGAGPATQPTDSGKLTLTTWAPTGFLKNPTALTFDREGRCYVSQTQRREGGEMTTRDHPNDHLLPDLTFKSVEDRARFGGRGDATWGDQTGGKKETITLLEDSHHTGKADKATTFYEGFDRNLGDILAGVMWFEGNVFATAAPDLWKLRDSRGDGHADEVQSISHGFAVHMGYPGHNMHGLAVGPDGKIYCTMGDKGINIPGPDGSRLDYHNTGTIVRMNPDGSDPEVFAYGVRNLFEFAFDKFGNLIGVDNDADYPKERERFVYITEGSDSGWRFHYQFRSAKFDVTQPKAEQKAHYNPWMDENMWVPYFARQAAYILPPLSNYSDGPAGFKYATEACLNEKYAGSFFLTQFPKALITTFKAKPKGAGFEMMAEHTISRGVQCIGLAFGPDGALYGAEWGNGGYKLKHTGSVVKLDDPVAAQSELRQSTHALLAEGPYQKSIDELAGLLGHADMRVRLDAQFELVRRRSAQTLIDAAFGQSPQMARIHSFWGLGQLVAQKALSKDQIEFIVSVLSTKACTDPDAEIRGQGVKLLGAFSRSDIPLNSAEAATAGLLHDPSPRVRYFAAVSLGQFHDGRNISALLSLAAENKPIDPYIRLAAILGLTGCGDPAALAEVASHPSQEEKLVAIVALRRLGSEKVATFLSDRDEQVVTEAARAIHDDDSITGALPALAKLIDRSSLTSEALLRRVLNANLRLGGAEHIEALARFAAKNSNPSVLRVEALEMLANWDKPAVADRVEGIYRSWPQRDVGEVKAMIEPRLPALLAASDSKVAQATAVLIDKLKLRTDDALFARWIADPHQAPATRVTALRLLANRKSKQLPEAINTALASSEPLVRAEATRVLAGVDALRAVAEIRHALAGNSMIEKQTAYRTLGTIDQPEADALLAESMDQLLSGKLSAELQLDVLESVEQRKSKLLSERVAKYEASLSRTDPLARFASTLHGGDIERGREVFQGGTESACIRCHSVGEVASTVGPNLAGIGSNPDKPRRYILESMIDPNAYIVPGFGMASFKLKDGSDVAGIVKSEGDAEVQLMDLEGQATSLRKSDIVSRTPAVSMMPAMGTILSKSEIRDVIEYVSSLKKN